MERKSSVTLPQRFNIVEELLERHVGATPKAIALHLISPESLKVASTVTYEQLGAITNRIGNGLLHAGVKREQRIAIMLNDGLEFAATFFGAMKIGVVPILFSTYLSEEKLLFLLNDSRAKALFLGDDLTTKISGIRDKLEFTKRIVSPKGSSGISYDEFTRNELEYLKVEPTSRDDVAFWFFTSGSTGMPKGVVHLHHDLYYAGLTYYDDVLHALPTDIFLSGAKLYFSAGLGFGLYGPLIMGASTVLYPERPSASAMLEIIGHARPTAFLGVPTLYAQMLQIVSSGQNDISSVRIFAAGGEPLSPQTFAGWKQKTGVEITEAIGSAEIGHHYISNVPGAGRPGTCGKLMVGYEARIVDDKFHEAGPEEMGTLLIKGESTFAYYWHMKEATRRTILGEWINT
ncbi:MAG: AMP-binding protein, partial [Nitrososphaerales archaeon]